MQDTKRRVSMLCLLGLLAGSVAGCSSTPSSGEVGVVRNGRAWYWPLDWFDNHNIRGTVRNGSSTTWVGLGSDVHYYPMAGQQRFIKLAACYYGQDGCDADGPPFTVPTSDGVESTIQGTIYVDTAFDNSKAGLSTVKAFDNQFSTRTFGSDNKHPYDGNSGWSDWLTAIVLPIAENNMRDVIAGTACADLVSSCALVQNSGNLTGKNKSVSALVRGRNNQQNLTNVQDAIGSGLAQDLRTTLGRDYFHNITFKLTKVTLPRRIQDGIDSAQAAFAAISQAQARIAKATADASANKQKQNGYKQCPTCAEIDALQALPRGLQALGGNIGLTLGATKGK